MPVMYVGLVNGTFICFELISLQLILRFSIKFQLLCMLFVANCFTCLLCVFVFLALTDLHNFYDLVIVFICVLLSFA